MYKSCTQCTNTRAYSTIFNSKCMYVDTTEPWDHVQIEQFDPRAWVMIGDFCVESTPLMARTFQVSLNSEQWRLWHS